jgi:hypothetical protein
MGDSWHAFTVSPIHHTMLPLHSRGAVIFSNAQRMNPNDEMAHQNARYAVRFSPAIGSPWWNFDSRWLGQCAFNGTTFVRPVIQHVPNALHERLTAGPRRHGWHATLKAPFELARGINTAILEHGVDAIALRWHPTVIPSFDVAPDRNPIVSR